MLKFYPAAEPKTILDATYNAGRFWAGSTRAITRMDRWPITPVEYACDNREMPGVPSAAFDVVVFDPPHIGNQGRDKSRKDYAVRFGVAIPALKVEGYTMSFLYPPFLVCARRVLTPTGLLFAKIGDQVNNHRSHWSHLDFMSMAEAAGFTVCDLIVKVRKGPMMSSKWKTFHHARKRHCFWVICRNNGSCERE